MKTCAKCKHTKPLCDFYKSERYKDGYNTRCKICAVQASKESKAKAAASRMPQTQKLDIPPGATHCTSSPRLYFKYIRGLSFMWFPEDEGFFRYETNLTIRPIGSQI